MSDLNSLKASCLNKSSFDCDKKVEDFCRLNPTDKDFCGCSVNMLKDAPDPALGFTPVKCWSDKCNKNSQSYKFFFVKDETCPQVCIDQSSITALGSNITGSTFQQSSCGGEIDKKKDPKDPKDPKKDSKKDQEKDQEKDEKSFTKIYVGVIIACFVILSCISMSISLILFIK